MSCFIIDLDGTTFHWGTDTFLPNAEEKLKVIHDKGHQIIFVTARESMTKESVYTQRLLKDKFPKCQIIFEISSPRIVINDEGAYAVNNKKDWSWESFDLEHRSVR